MGERHDSTTNYERPISDLLNFYSAASRIERASPHIAGNFGTTFHIQRVRLSLLMGFLRALRLTGRRQFTISRRLSKLPPTSARTVNCFGFISPSQRCFTMKRNTAMPKLTSNEPRCMRSITHTIWVARGLGFCMNRAGLRKRHPWLCVRW